MIKLSKEVYNTFWAKHNARNFKAESDAIVDGDIKTYPCYRNDCPLCGKSNTIAFSGHCNSCGTSVSNYICKDHESDLYYSSCMTSELRCIHSYPLPYRDRFRQWRYEVKWWFKFEFINTIKTNKLNLITLLVRLLFVVLIIAAILTQEYIILWAILYYYITASCIDLIFYIIKYRKEKQENE